MDEDKRAKAVRAAIHVLERRRAKRDQQIVKQIGLLKGQQGCGRDYARALKVMDLYQEYEFFRARSLRPIVRQTEWNVQTKQKFDVFVLENLRTQQRRVFYFLATDATDYRLQVKVRPFKASSEVQDAIGFDNTDGVTRLEKKAAWAALCLGQSLNPGPDFIDPADPNVVVLARQRYSRTDPRLTSDKTARVCESCLALECIDCQKRAFRLCGGCRRAYYCSTECQRYDWSDGHKQMCAQTTQISR